MALTLEQVRHVAGLARLALTPDEEQRFREQLSAILDAVEQLKTLDTSGVEPTSHATLGEVVLREDVMVPSKAAEQVLKQAPATVGSSFAVPKILE